MRKAAVLFVLALLAGCGPVGLAGDVAVGSAKAVVGVADMAV